MATKKTKKVSGRSKKNKKIDKDNIARMLIPLGVSLVFVFVLYRIINLIVDPTDLVMIKNGTVFNEESAIGYVIRDEKIAEGNYTNSRLIQIKSEGEKVAKGNQVYRAAIENEDEINTKIDELNVKIQEGLLGQIDMLPSDVKAIESQIEVKIDGLKLKNDIQEISEYKKDINTYITKKSKIAGDLSPAGSYIKGLIEERENYQNQLMQNSKYVVAPMSGVVSYRVDGLEEKLTLDSFSSLNKNMLEELNLQTGQIVSTSNEKAKIINNYECYIATILDSNQAKETALGKKIVLRLSSQEEVNATISHIAKQEDKSVLLVFKINECVEKLIDYRKITFDIIWSRYEGLKVPKSAIYYKNGLSYVVRNRGGYQDEILIEILKENDNYCIVDNYDNEDLKNLGFSSQEINSMKSISIYDEIVINPKIQ